MGCRRWAVSGIWPLAFSILPKLAVILHGWLNLPVNIMMPYAGCQRPTASALSQHKVRVLCMPKSSIDHLFQVAGP